MNEHFKMKLFLWGGTAVMNSVSTGLLAAGIQNHDDGLLGLGVLGLGLTLWYLSYVCRPWFKTRLTLKNGYWGLAMLAALIVVSLGWVSWTLWVNGVPTTGNQSQLNQLLANSGWRQWLMMAQVVIVAPIIEESLYRALFQVWFFTKNPKWQLVISSLAFAFIHAGFDSWAGTLYFAAGLILGYGFQRTKDLKINISVHLTYNLLSLIL